MKKGNYPNPEYYEFASEFDNWKIYKKTNNQNMDFIALKLISVIGRKNNNYWLTYYVSEQRLVISKSSDQLKSGHGEIYQRVVEWCATNLIAQ